MNWHVLIKAFRGNKTLYSDCGHKHRSIEAAKRCQRRISQQEPEPGVTIAFVDLRLVGGTS
ncbi:hypothetical protein [Methylotuvimicrobium sp. KM1]|uniref:hypothetical protein n=1 Tax=unclassified Methylotuvimicrobium TaxID=2822412 RepID=UPI00384BF262